MKSSAKDKAAESFPEKESDYHPAQVQEPDQIGLFTETQLSANCIFIGYDEAGRGALAGPVSVGAVVFAPVVLPYMQRRGFLPMLDDSKDMAPKIRERYFPVIQRLALGWGIAERSAEAIDARGLNVVIEEAMFEAGEKCLAAIESKLNPLLNQNLQIMHLVDGNYRFKSEAWLGRKNKGHITRSVVKGDSKLVSIASASVLAKVHRDRFMQKAAARFKEYNWAGNKGYATADHLKAIEKIGRCELHRKSFQLKAIDGTEDSSLEG